MEINLMYTQLCDELIIRGKKRNGTLELTNKMFTLRNITNNIITCRQISYKYILAELIWYFAGSNNMKFISQFASLWEKISDDGITSNSAYGHILMNKHGFNQIETIIELLKKDPNSRRAVLNINTPNENVIETKDEPCTIFLQFNVINNKLNCTAVMRSNDIWFGLPYDVIFFTELQKHIARELGYEYGEFTMFDVSLHVYERDYEKIVSLCEDEKKYLLNGERLIELAAELIQLVNKDNIINVCLEKGVINEARGIKSK